MKKKILLVNQSSFIHTGYGIMGHEVLSRLHANPEFEVAELACDIRPDHEQISSTPWKVYGNLPTSNEEDAAYKSNPLNPFGRWKFDDVVREFKPNYIISWRDNWMDAFIGRSPFKKYYQWIYMPTVDAPSQNKDWLEDYALADILYTYQDWSREQLQLESGGRLKAKVCSPATHTYPLNKIDLQRKMGFTGPIIGTVMRNQGRKRFPEFFRGISKLIKKYPNLTVLCHTSFPDKNGWDIPKLLLDNGVAQNIHFSYKCRSCNEVYPSVYQGILTFCRFCKERNCSMCSSGNGLNNDQLNILYNLMDIYVQFSQNEGFCIPLLDAASAGTPIMAPNHSAMISALNNLYGIPIELAATTQEMESDRIIGIPSIDNMVIKLDEFLSLTKEQQLEMGKYALEGSTSYSWDKMVSIITEDIRASQTPSWTPQRDIRAIPKWSDKLLELKPSEFVRWCIMHVLQDKTKINSYFESKYIAELNATVRHNVGTTSSITPKHVFNEMVQLREYINICESSL